MAELVAESAEMVIGSDDGVSAQMLHGHPLKYPEPDQGDRPGSGQSYAGQGLSTHSIRKPRVRFEAVTVVAI